MGENFEVERKGDLRVSGEKYWTSGLGYEGKVVGGGCGERTWKRRVYIIDRERFRKEEETWE